MFIPRSVVRRGKVGACVRSRFRGRRVRVSCGHGAGHRQGWVHGSVGRGQVRSDEILEDKGG